MKPIRTLFCSILATLALLCPSVGVAENHSSPTLLTIEGAGSKTQTLTYDMLRDLPMVDYQTTTIWTDGIQKFQGVPLKALLADMAHGMSEVKATAVNDYAVSIPLSEINDEAPIIAYKVNDKRMTLRGKGPLWLVYPYDRSSQYRSEIVYSRSIWQLTRLQLN